MIFFDVGANLGQYSLMAANIAGSKNIACDIYCFEPSAATFRLLGNNTKSVKSINCFNIALGEAKASATLYSDGEAWGWLLYTPATPMCWAKPWTSRSGYW